jgi:hypothetical protein
MEKTVCHTEGEPVAAAKLFQAVVGMAVAVGVYCSDAVSSYIIWQAKVGQYFVRCIIQLHSHARLQTFSLHH